MASRVRGPSPEEVRAQLAKILSDSTFVRSERLRRFLLMTVEKTLSGETADISEYTLGREVFDRNRDYDPRIDSIVRVEARRLRNKLDHYYRTAGSTDPIVIDIQQGSYVPRFRYTNAEPAAPAVDPKTVAVLPFMNMSAAQEQEFFCDGITEEIINTLSRVPELHVVARTSVFYFKNTFLDVREIGARVGAGTVIEGSVRRADHNVRIAVKVINASTGLTLWSGNFDRELGDVFLLQTEIATAIADTLRVTLNPARSNAGNLEAYSFFLKGRYYWHQRSQRGAQEALESFAKAIELNPDYAPPYAALADAYGHFTFWGAIPPREGAERAKQAAERALRLDDTMADAYATLGGLASLFDWKWEEGERLLRRAIDLEPSNVHALELFSIHLMYLGRFAEAQAAIERALQLDPLSARGVRFKAFNHYYQGQFEQAIEVLRKETPLDATSHEGDTLLGWSLIRLGRYEEAITVFERLPDGPFLPVKLGALGEAYGAAGRSEDAREAIRKLDQLAESSYAPLRSWAYIYAGMGDWDQALGKLEEAYQNRSPWMATLKVDPRFDPVRQDARFKDLLARLELGDVESKPDIRPAAV